MVLPVHLAIFQLLFSSYITTQFDIYPSNESGTVIYSANSNGENKKNYVVCEIEKKLPDGFDVKPVIDVVYDVRKT